MSPVDPRQLRDVMGGFATGVAIVTTRSGDSNHGMTVNSLTSVSLDPPLLLVCLTRDSRTARAVEERGAFVVNLLATPQSALSDRFAKRGEDHFEGRDVTSNDRGLPVLDRGLGWLDCDVDATHDGGDHVIFVGRVVSCEARSGTPLVFFKGRYHEVSGRGTEAALEWYW
jgi:flavin reductase (DIM6/NTAB) family NADH-FMN oxidoreductase RutF